MVLTKLEEASEDMYEQRLFGPRCVALSDMFCHRIDRFSAGGGIVERGLAIIRLQSMSLQFSLPLL